MQQIFTKLSTGTCPNKQTNRLQKKTKKQTSTGRQSFLSTASRSKCGLEWVHKRDREAILMPTLDSGHCEKDLPDSVAFLQPHETVDAQREGGGRSIAPNGVNARVVPACIRSVVGPVAILVELKPPVIPAWTVEPTECSESRG